MTNPNEKLASLGDQILRSLDQLPSKDPKTKAVREHVRALMSALSEPERNTETPPPQRVIERGTLPPGRNPAQTLPPPGEEEHPSDFARPPFNSPGYASESTQLRPPSVVPRTFAGRRALRRAAGITLKQVAEKAQVTLPTARMYEANRYAVTKPEKRADLDRVYAEFQIPR